ncbi:alpha/beta hydrolase, partial [Streptomyces sp. MCAF7]
MSVRRRTLLGLGAAAATGVGMSLLGSSAAAGTLTPRMSSPRQAPTAQFAIGVRQFNWFRGNRQL